MQIDRMKPQEFAAVYRILEQSFPTDEYRPFAEQQALFEDERYIVYVLRDEQDAVCGLLAMWEFPAFDFLEHFAMLPALRGKGYGAWMLREILRERGRPACLEVEPPTDDITRRRIAFYERSGLYFTDFPYVQPPISKGKQPVPLHIMATKPLSREAFEEIKAVLYREVYHV